MKVLLIEDDVSFCDFIRKQLGYHYHIVDIVNDGKSAREMLDFSYDLIIIDVRLPDVCGIQLLRHIRSLEIIVPILMLTASSEDLVRALDSGADDYLKKPCSTEELLARMRALMRRGKSVENLILTWGNLSLDPAKKKVFLTDREVNLRPKEYQLLELLLRNPDRVFSRDTIIDRLWTMAEVPTNHAVTNLMKDLRRRLQQAGLIEECIETVYGMGYRLKSFSSNVAAKVPSKTQDSLTEIQDKFIATLAEKMQILRHAITLLKQKKLSPDQLQESQRIAHQLAGTLGMFGYPRATTIARSIELQLKQATDKGIEELFEKLEKEIVKPPKKISFSDPLPITHTLLLVNNDMSFADTFYLETIDNQFVVEVAEESTIFSELERNIPSVVVLFLSTSNSLNILQQIHQAYPNLPSIVVDIQSDSLDRRVEVAQYQPHRYFVAPVSPVPILQAAAELIVTKPKAKIMVMDDDPLFLSFITQILELHAFVAICLSDPTEFWQVLKSTQPDLLLLDWEMPNYNGIELCQVIRQDAQFTNLPIVFVTKHNNLCQELFHAGADDVIIKPITLYSEFITRIKTRLTRILSND